jgi:hypothetical protein
MPREEFCILEREIPMHSAFCFTANEEKGNMWIVLSSHILYACIFWNSLNFRCYIGVYFFDTVRLRDMWKRKWVTEDAETSNNVQWQSQVFMCQCSWVLCAGKLTELQCVIKFVMSSNEIRKTYNELTEVGFCLTTFHWYYRSLLVDLYFLAVCWLRRCLS